MKPFFFFLLFTLSLNACGQVKKDRLMLGKTNAELELKTALSNKKVHNVINKERIVIKNSLIAIKIAEPILFDIYGKDNIIDQRPYEIYFINNYWVISGTLPIGSKGGTFLIILDAKDCKILRITHDK